MRPSLLPSIGHSLESPMGSSVPGGLECHFLLPHGLRLLAFSAGHDCLRAHICGLPYIRRVNRALEPSIRIDFRQTESNDRSRTRVRAVGTPELANYSMTQTR